MTAAPSLALPPRVRFPGLSSAAFEHPADRAALEALRRTPGSTVCSAGCRTSARSDMSNHVHGGQPAGFAPPVLAPL